MKVLIITQNEPFYLVRSIEYLLKILPSKVEKVGIIINSVSPFGKPESFLQNFLYTIQSNLFYLNVFQKIFLR